ncbi:hypothetical protein M3Y97_00531100 [Aphelenchoides bicaudatus]|nr:hypothetical protein M3Y97_00531100 [Aphelenchoides bicaudatus]
MSLMCSKAMVCVPCIILPVLTFIYIRFIQPLILRFIPDRWKAKFDSVLYPTCPINMDDPPKPATSQAPTDNQTAQACPYSTSGKTKSADEKKDE